MADNNSKAGKASGEHAAGESRRDFLKQSSFLTAVAITPGSLLKAANQNLDEKA